MLDDNYYIRFDTKHNYIVYYNGKPVYGKELVKVFSERYSNMALDEQRLAFENDINEAYREYARVCHIPIIFDKFTDGMKTFLCGRALNERRYICEYQNMTRKQLFKLFDGADINLLYEVSVFINNFVSDEIEANQEDGLNDD